MSVNDASDNGLGLPVADAKEKVQVRAQTDVERQERREAELSEEKVERK